MIFVLENICSGNMLIMRMHVKFLKILEGVNYYRVVGKEPETLLKYEFP